MINLFDKERAKEIFESRGGSLEAVMMNLDISFDLAMDLLKDDLTPSDISRCYEKMLIQREALYFRKEIDQRSYAVSTYLLLRTLAKAYGDHGWLLGYFREETLKDLCLAHHDGNYKKVISGCEDFEEDFQHQQMIEYYEEMLRNGNL